MSSRSRFWGALSLGCGLLAVGGGWQLWQRGVGSGIELPRAAVSEHDSAFQERSRPPTVGASLRWSGEDPSPEATIRATAVDDLEAGPGVMEGSVLSLGSSEPVAQAELTFARGGRVFSAVTDRDGRFLFRASESGVHELVSVMAEGYVPFAPEWGHSPIRLQARPERRLRNIIVYLEATVAYEGRVTGPTGEPVEGAELVVLGGPQGLNAITPLSAAMQTDEQGMVVFQASPGAVIEARHRDFGSVRRRVGEPPPPGEPVLFRLRPGGVGNETIGGLVVDHRGRPVAEALVLALAGRRAGAQCLTDQEGRFVLEGLDRGRYHLTATAEGWSPGRARAVATGRSDVRMELTPGGTLFGVVREEEQGEPVPSFSVTVEERVGPLRRLVYRSQGFLDAEGRYEIAGLEPQEYVVTVSAPGYAPSAPRPFTVASAEERQRVDFELSAGGRVTGVVTDAETGEAIAEARVVLEGSGQASLPLPQTARAVTDAEGRFELTGLASGRRSLMVEAPGYHRHIRSGMEIREGRGQDLLRIDLRPTAEGESPRWELTGIGALLAPRDSELVILRVLEGGGAAEAGLQAGDAILWIDGRPVTDLGFAGAVEQIRGEVGTSVRLSIRRGADGSALELSVPRLLVRG